MTDMAKEELLFRLSMLEQEAKKLQEQIELINQQQEEFEILKGSLKKIDSSKEKEFLASLGKGIFIKSEIKDKKLFVNVGEGIVVKKKPEEAIEIIDKQIKELNKLRVSLMEQLENLNSEMRKLVESVSVK